MNVHDQLRRTVLSQVPGQSPNLMYHVAPASAEPDILKFGLDPEMEQRSTTPSWNERGIYLWDSLEVAQRFAEQQYGEQALGNGTVLPGEPYHIWEIRDPDDDELLPDAYGDERPDLTDYQHSWYTTEPISPDQLRRVT